MDAIDVLKKYWGHTQFRLRQEEIIQQIGEKKDTLALLPTGGGKSVCYQVPTIMEEGICLVISPLISLMIDQVRFLQSKGIKSVFITSAMQYNQIDTVLTNCIYGGIKFLYLSPEKLQNNLVKKRIKEMNINLITVDEAHCISEWGHDFRPSYRYISDIREVFPSVPILALTATATKNVINDIQDNLDFRQQNLIQSSFYRENISYVVDDTKNKEERLLKLLSKIKSSVIVYVETRKKAEEINKFLLENNYSSNYYHAGLAEDERIKREESWSKNQTRIIIATSAFGMGIDKSDIKLVVHMQLPSSIESYFQQAGRAGRNGKQAYTFLLANNTDIIKRRDLLNLKYPLIKEIKIVYQRLADYFQIAENVLPIESFSFDINKFSEHYKINKLKVLNSIKYLQKEEYLKLNYIFHTPAKVKIIITRSSLYKFQIANQYYDRFIKFILRSYANIFNNYIIIDEKNIAIALNINIDEVKRILNKLMQLGVLKYIYNKYNDSQISYMRARLDINSLHLDEKKWKERKNNEEYKLVQIANYTTERIKCRSVILLNYFGENSVACGKCDICIYKKRNKIKDMEYKNITSKIANILIKQELTIEEICTLIPSVERKKITNILDVLFDNDQVSKFGNKYQWKEA